MDEVSKLPLVIAVAVNESSRSKNAVIWTLDKFVPEGKVTIKLLHVRPRILRVPNELGIYIPISNVREEVADAYRKEVEWKTNEMLLSYKKICAQRKVEAETMVIEADDVAETISKTIAEYSITKLVLAASSRSPITRKISSTKMSSRISQCIPSFCTVYVVSKGQLLSVRASGAIPDDKFKDENGRSSISSGSFTSHSSSLRSEWTEIDTRSESFKSYPPLGYTFSDLPSSNGTIILGRRSSLGINEAEQSSTSSKSDKQIRSQTSSSTKSYQSDNPSYSPHEVIALENMKGLPRLEDQETNINLELERLRIELRHLKEMRVLAENESSVAHHQLKELRERREEEAARLEEIRLREEKTKELVKQERERQEVARKEADFIRQRVQYEVLRKLDAEGIAEDEANETKKLEKFIIHNDEPYTKYTYEEIESATLSFSETRKIGIGANGTVYKASFHHTTTAVKVLHSFEAHRTKQFKQELEILGKIRHPHLLLLLGACPERGFLVYEYMENGSLDDRLHRKNYTPPLPWYYRFRIAWEVASVLAFLHNTKPEPIIHRDLKPANILLDKNFVSKIGDVGLSTLVSSTNPSMSTMYKDTAPVGTICYIDPEYQRSGLVSTKSDVYALGIVILELLTGKSPMGLTYIVESALEDGSLMDILDSEAGKWPAEETKQMTYLGLSCAELRRKDRPDLKGHVVPQLLKLKEVADKACYDIMQGAGSDPPSHFICPILKEVMEDPCVACDGYTYDQKAIELWFRTNDKSPMTNLKMSNKTLIPNHSLRSAIKEWKARRQ